MAASGGIMQRGERRKSAESIGFAKFLIQRGMHFGLMQIPSAKR